MEVMPAAVVSIFFFKKSNELRSEFRSFDRKIIVGIGKSFPGSFVIPATTSYVEINRFTTQGKVLNHFLIGKTM